MQTAFNIEKDSEKLKVLVSVYEPSIFLAEITELLKYDGHGRIPYRPFISLDSPLRQLTYLANLNLSSDPSTIIKKSPPTPEEWDKIIEYAVRVKAGYYDALLPTAEDDEDEFKDLYRTAMPVFFDYHYTGVINYEEQEIERISHLFTPFDEIIEERLSLKTSDFLSIYNQIDEIIEANLNEPLKLLREDPEVVAFADEMKKKEIPPAGWNYKGKNKNVKRFIEILNNHLVRNTLTLKKSTKTNRFLQIFNSSRSKSKYQYYTESNPILLCPIYILDEDEFILLSHKQLLHAIYKVLYNIVSSSKKAESLFEHRGKYLQKKILHLFKNFFKGKGHYYDEYRVEGKGQDILILYGGIAFIIEAKSGKETIVSGVPNVKHLYSQYLNTFKKNIDKAYEQCFRVKEKFIDGDPLKICDKKDKLIFEVRTKNYRKAFSIIVTQDRFRKPQINLPDLLDLYEDDDNPLSFCIDDLEIIILTMVKQNISPGHFERLLINRQRLQGRLESNDELEIWGEFLFSPDFKVPEDPRLHYVTSAHWINRFDRLYAKGLGFDNERKIEKKQSNQWKVFMGFNEPNNGGTNIRRCIASQ